MFPFNQLKNNLMEVTSNTAIVWLLWVCNYINLNWLLISYLLKNKINYFTASKSQKIVGDSHTSKDLSRKPCVFEWNMQIIYFLIVSTCVCMRKKNSKRENIILHFSCLLYAQKVFILRYKQFKNHREWAYSAFQAGHLSNGTVSGSKVITYNEYVNFGQSLSLMLEAWVFSHDFLSLSPKVSTVLPPINRIF